MCGIAGVFSYRSGIIVSETELDTLTHALRKRGPDGSGRWVSQDKSRALVHTRLAIIDPVDRAAQPMLSERGDLALSYNGEIYNFLALRKKLQSLGEQFKTQSDTEVLLKLYARYGADMLPMLRGMFVFIIVDTQKNETFCARDPYGIKPLYWHRKDGVITFASQVKAIASLPRVSREPDAAGLISFGLFGSVQQPHTCFEEIESVPPGSFVRVSKNGDIKTQRYCSFTDEIPQDSTAVSVQERDEQIKAVFRDSVSAHMVSDVSVGVFLSAGIDSGAVLGMASDISSKNIGATTLAFADFRNTNQDEAVLAQTLARQYQSRHHVSYIQDSDVEAASADFFTAMDQPSIDGLNTWLVSRAAHEQGYKVMLSGLGADELLGGYPSFSDIPRLIKYRRHLGASKSLGRFATHILKRLQNIGLNVHPKNAGLFAFGQDFATGYFLKRCLLLPWELDVLFAKDFIEAGLEDLNWEHLLREKLYNAPDNAFKKVALLENYVYMQNQLLRDADWAGMASSVEIRTPFVDYNLFSALSRSLPLSDASRDANVGQNIGKRLLAESPNRPLPNNQINRPKTGFELPYTSWLNSIPAWQSWRANQSLAGKRCPWPRRWAYNVLQHYFDDESHPAFIS